MKDLRKRKAESRRLSPVKEWLDSLTAPPFIETIDRNGIWDISEAVWIDRMRQRGEPLLNLASVVD